MQNSQPKHEIISALNSYNLQKLDELGYSMEEWYGLPGFYTKNSFIIAPMAAASDAASATEYRGLVGINTNDENLEKSMDWWNHGRQMEHILLTKKLGLERRDNVYSTFKDDKTFIFFQTEKPVSSVEVVDASLKSFENYFNYVKNHLNKAEVVEGIKGGESMLHGYYSQNQELEFIEILPRIELMSSKELLHNLAKCRDVAEIIVLP